MHIQFYIYYRFFIQQINSKRFLSWDYELWLRQTYSAFFLVRLISHRNKKVFFCPTHLILYLTLLPNKCLLLFIYLLLFLLLLFYYNNWVILMIINNLRKELNSGINECLIKLLGPKSIRKKNKSENDLHCYSTRNNANWDHLI